MSQVTELRLLTDKAKQTRFDFIWQIKGCKMPLLAVMDAEIQLRRVLTAALGEHGVLM